MIHRFVFALLLALCAPAMAADTTPPVNRFASALVPAERFEIGATLVERHGQRGSPLIFIPGLASGAWVWQETVRQTMGDHVVYVLTLPGFDGRPTVPGKGMAAALDSLRELITSRKLVKPVLVGHSLGGMIALDLASHSPDLIGGVVTLDGLPLMPGSEQWQPEQRAEMAASMASRMKASSQAAFAAQQQGYMRMMGVTDISRADALAELTGRSDPNAVTSYAVDAMSVDLRKALPSIKVPVLVIAPYFEPDAGQRQITQAMMIEYYRGLMEGTPNLKVVSVAPARHFAMFDQPQAVNDAILGFLTSLPK
jgi:pimeloyl-ACP methyl ester carboxylesterase